MRILFVLHTFPPRSWGGTELHVDKIAKVLDDKHDVRIFCRDMDESLPHGGTTKGYREGIDITRFNNLDRDNQSFESLYRNRLAHEAFERELLEFKPDVVHIHHLIGLSTSFVEICKEQDIAVVYSLHDFWMVCPKGQRLDPGLRICEDIDRNKCYTCLQGLWPQWFPDRLAEPTIVNDRGDLSPRNLAEYDRHMLYILNLCDLLLTPSEFHRQRMAEFNIDPRSIIALDHGLDHSEFKLLKDSQQPVRCIGYIGTVIPTKGVHVLVDAFRILQDRDIELRIYGDAPSYHGNDTYVEELQSLSLGCAGKVRFMGSYENSDVPSILEHVDALVVPSLWWETFSLTIREALLAGVPVLASNIGAMKEALESSRAGMLFEMGDAGDLAKKLQELIDDKELRVQMSNRRLEVKTIERNAEDYLEVYKKARRKAKRRSDSLVVAPATFPETPEQDSDASPETPGTTSVPPTTTTAADGDVRFSVEKLGGGDVQVASSVERGESTRVSFVLDYDDDTPPGEVKVVIDFGGGSPHASNSQDTESGNQESDVPMDSSAALAQNQFASFQDMAHEKAMYMLDESVLSKHVKELDELVEDNHLEGGDQVPRKLSERRKPGRDSQKSAPRDKPDTPTQKDEAPATPRQDDRRGSGKPSGDTRSKAPRKGRDKRGADTGPKREPKKRPDRGPRDRKAAAPEKKREAPAPTTAKPTKDGAVVWGSDVSTSWTYPENEEAPRKEEPKKKAPNFRIGQQPTVKSVEDSGGFGDGVKGSD